MQNRRGYSNPQIPPTPKSEAPASDAAYEVIEFSQQYTNTALPRKVTKPNEHKPNVRKCDLCGSSNAQFHCELCAQQTFCVSCDQMYHRHPKRRTHIRKKIQLPVKENVFEPPLPPKNESSQAPIPPPRRNKRIGRISTPSPTPPGTFKKNGSLMGSLKRFMGGIQSPSPQPRCIRNDSRPHKFPLMSQQIDFDQQSTGRDSGYLDWETDSRHRSSSFSSNTFNRPAFPGLTQAQSMAQLNCPSCHVHSVPPWDWNRSHMNLHAFQPPWTGLTAGNPWHGSMMFPPAAYRMPPNEQFARRGSVQGHRTPHRIRKFEIENDSDSDLSVGDDRKSRKQSPPMATRNVSPALSRRSRKTVVSDSDDDDVVSRKSDRKYKRRGVPMSREPSPALSRRGYRRKYDDDDAMSMRSVGSRRSVKTVAHKPFLRKNVTPSSDDSDDELTSERDGNENTPETAGTRPDAYETWQKRPLQNAQPTKAVDVRQEKTGDQNGDWACQHCTYLNEQSLRVCKMCCKSKTCLKSDESNKVKESRLEESMKNLKLSTANDGEKKKGDEEDRDSKFIKTTSTGTSPPPQTISTQTYEVPNYVGKRNRSFTCDDYSDWQPVKRSNSTVSCSSDKQSSSIRQDSTPSSDYIQALLQTDAKQGIEIVKLLKEAEQHQFEVDDVAAALAQCGDMNPIKWLLENWNKMIDTVLALATNYGQEQSENIIGTISSVEAQAALRLHHGDIWRAATECIRQRQKKYAKLMANGNFSREDVVTVLTANHGDMEAAFMELNKTQLKPFLMKIWGPPQGLDNDSGNLSKSFKIQENPFEKTEQFDKSRRNFGRVHTWLEAAINSRTEMDFDNDEIENQLKQSYYNSKLCDECPSKGGKCGSFLNRYNSFDNLNATRLNRFQNRSFCTSLEALNLRYQSVRDHFATQFLPSPFLADSAPDSEEEIRNYLINKGEKENKADERNENRNLGNEPEKLLYNVDDHAGCKNVKSDETESECYDSAHDLGDELVQAHEYVGVGKCETDLDKLQSIEDTVDVSNEASTDTCAPNSSSANPIHKRGKYLSFLQISLSDIPAFASTALSKGHDSSAPTSIICTHLTPSTQTTSASEAENINSARRDSTEKHLETTEAEKHQFYENVEAIISHDSKNQNLIASKNSSLTSENVNSTVAEENSLLSELKALYLLAKYNLDYYVIEMKDSPIQNVNYIKTFVNDRSQNEIATTNKRTCDNNETNTSENESTITNAYEAKLGNGECETRQDLWDEIQGAENDVNNSAEPYETDANSDESSYEEILEFATDNSNMVDDAAESEEEHSSKADLEVNIFRESQFNRCWKTAVAVVYEVKPMYAIPVNINDRLLRADKVLYEPINETSGSHYEDEREPLPHYEIEEETELKLRATSNTRSNELVQNGGDNYEDHFNKPINDHHIDIAIGQEHVAKKNEKTPDLILMAEERQNSAAVAEEIANLPERLVEGMHKVNEEDDNSFQNRARRCLSEGLVATYHQAELAVRLMEMKFDRSQSVDAAIECTSIQSAITYLQQECQLCAEKLSMKQMISMLKCEHRCCQECARQFFSLQINEKSIDNCVCPFCGEPSDISRLDSDAAVHYFSNLDIMLKTILKPETHELFQRKLRDRTLEQDPNFKWCPKCSFGFIADLDLKRIACPSCRFVSCAKCGNLWEKEHNEKSCEQYKEWLATQNDSSIQLSNYLADYGVTCPRCATKFILVKGGCMHLTCTNCKFEFCSDCLKTFSMGADCKISDYCVKLGLHAHHPRNCLFYLRDKEPQELKQLLLENNIQLNLRKTTSQRCDIQLQKETDDGLVDIKCDAKVEEGGLCRIHYIEYLASLLRKNKIDPVVIFDLAEILQEFRRRGKSLPIRAPNTFEHEYRRYCIQIVKEEMPLD